jgi:hypothetical protein
MISVHDETKSFYVSETKTGVFAVFPDECGASHFLCSMIDRMVNFNESEKLPYHNSLHALRVVRTLLNAMQDNVFEDQHFMLDDSGIYNVKVNILLAAIFHDFNHTGSSDVDLSCQYERPNNINNALLGLREYAGSFPIAEMFINATGYPYGNIPFHYITSRSFDDIFDFGIGLIRDCDRINFLEHEWIDTWIFNGISLEMGQWKWHNDEEIYQNFSGWIEKETWFTHWGQKQYNANFVELENGETRVSTQFRDIMKKRNDLNINGNKFKFTGNV